MSRDSLGVVLTILGAIFWGFSGACGQWLFENRSVSANWLVPWRLFIGGAVIMVFYLFTNHRAIFLPLKNIKDYPALITYSLVGLMLCQYTYFYGIELSNAAIATTIQYTAPTFIVILLCVFEKRLPKIKEILALILASFGVFLLATHMKFDTLIISKEALFICLLSAFCVVVYSIVPRSLNQKYPVFLVLGWGLILGGFVLGIYTKFWTLPGVFDFKGILALLGVGFLGTTLAFGFYMCGLKIIGASRASMIASIEPVSSAVFAYFWLGVDFVIFDYLGFLAILLCTFILRKA